VKVSSDVRDRPTLRPGVVVVLDGLFEFTGRAELWEHRPQTFHHGEPWHQPAAREVDPAGDSRAALLRRHRLEQRVSDP
jgi:hypothetical protein